MKMAVGLMLVVMSVVHVIYGEKMQVSVLKRQEADSMLIASYRVMSLQGGLILLGVGVVEIMTYTGIMILSGAANYIPLAVVAMNVFAVLFFGLVKHRELLKTTVPQFIIFSIILFFQAISL